LIDPDQLTVTTLASGGSRGDFAHAGPGGAVYVTQSDQIDVFEPVTTALQVVASDPANGAELTVTRTTAQVRFNLDVTADDPAAAHSATNPANYLLVGSRSGPVSITSVDYDRPSRTVTLHFGALDSDRYVLLVRPEIRTVAGHEMDAPYTAIFHLAMAPHVIA